MQGELYQQCLDLMNREMVPAQGCTEPVAVALACAKAASLLPPDEKPVKVEASISRNIVKNAMSVIIPGTGLYGAEYACALGTAGGRAELGLEVLSRCGEEEYARAKAMVEGGCIHISLAPGDEPIYIEARVSGKEHSAKAVICGMHDRFTLLERDGEVLLCEASEPSTPSAGAAGCGRLTLRDVWEFAHTADLGDLGLVYEAVRLNTAISRDGLEHSYGLLTGRLLCDQLERQPDGGSVSERAIMRTLAAIDARMAGSTLSVMSNSGSGNQGITATLPVWSVAVDLKLEEEPMIRAVTFSHLVAIYIKEHLDRLSSLCGAIVAAVGAGCAVTWLQGGDYDAVERTLINILASVTGMICDGAKPSCALKVSTALTTCFQGVMLSLNGIRVAGIDGIVADGAEETIDILGRLTKQGMRETDRVILDIMLDKTATV